MAGDKQTNKCADESRGNGEEDDKRLAERFIQGRHNHINQGATQKQRQQQTAKGLHHLFKAALRHHPIPLRHNQLRIKPPVQLIGEAGQILAKQRAANSDITLLINAANRNRAAALLHGNHIAQTINLAGWRGHPLVQNQIQIILVKLRHLHFNINFRAVGLSNPASRHPAHVGANAGSHLRHRHAKLSRLVGVDIQINFRQSVVQLVLTSRAAGIDSIIAATRLPNSFRVSKSSP